MFTSMSKSNVGYWTNPTAECLVALMLADPFVFGLLYSVNYLLRSRIHDLWRASFTMTLFSAHMRPFWSLPLPLLSSSLVNVSFGFTFTAIDEFQFSHLRLSFSALTSSLICLLLSISSTLPLHCLPHYRLFQKLAMTTSVPCATTAYCSPPMLLW